MECVSHVADGGEGWEVGSSGAAGPPCPEVEREEGWLVSSSIMSKGEGVGGLGGRLIAAMHSGIVFENFPLRPPPPQ